MKWGMLLVSFTSLTIDSCNAGVDFLRRIRGKIGVKSKKQPHRGSF